MAAGRLTSVQLVQAYQARIRAIDRSGPRINAVIEENPDALALATALDRERREKGPRGPLHGIPVLLKDNIATADAMQTTAGSLALLGSRPPRDAFVVARLRAAGVVILGKTNLSEWANFRSTRSTSGWSARGGLTKNPYALDRNTSGSSSGSAAAIAASLATLAVGTETDGSIVSPVVDQRPRRGEADGRAGEPQRHHPDRPVDGHGRPDDAHGPRRGVAAHRAGRQRRARRRRPRTRPGTRSRLHAGPRSARPRRQAARRRAQRVRRRQRPRLGGRRGRARGAEGSRRHAGRRARAARRRALRRAPSSRCCSTNSRPGWRPTSPNTPPQARTGASPT